MKKSPFLMLVMMIVPWFTLPLLGSRAIKRFLPATILSSICSELMHTAGIKLRLWKFHSSIHPKIRPSLAFTLGPEFIASLWMLKWGFGKFPFFLLINGIAHVLFTFPILTLLRKFRIASLVKMSRLHFFLLHTIRGLLLYGFQMGKEKLFPRRQF